MRQGTLDVDLGAREVISCNCSRCGRLGPAAGVRAHLSSGWLEAKAISRLQFHKHVIDHLFCSTRRSVFARQKAGWHRARGINVRCLEGVERPLEGARRWTAQPAALASAAAARSAPAVSRLRAAIGLARGAAEGSDARALLGIGEPERDTSGRGLRIADDLPAPRSISSRAMSCR